jgi:hypothetical protein
MTLEIAKESSSGYQHHRNHQFCREDNVSAPETLSSSVPHEIRTNSCNNDLLTDLKNQTSKQ